MNAEFQLFVYGPFPGGGSAPGAPSGSPAVITGTLYDTGDGYPALVLAGSGRVQGEILRYAVTLLARLDELAGVDRRLLRRVGLRVGERACWTYVAGPALARRLTADRRIAPGAWPDAPKAEQR